MSSLLPVPHFQQSDEGYCLPACARMVLSYLGLERDEAGISQILATKKYGTPSFAIERLSDPDIEVIYQEWSVAELLARLDAGHPVIVLVRTIFLDYYQEDFAHAMVFCWRRSGTAFLGARSGPANRPSECLLGWTPGRLVRV
jgi:hypothetical protein